MNRRNFLKRLAGGTLAALGLGAAVGKSEPPFFCIERHIRYNYADGLHQDVVIIDDVPNPAYHILEPVPSDRMIEMMKKYKSLVCRTKNNPPSLTGLIGAEDRSTRL